MGSEFETGVRGIVLHQGFRAQSVIKILVIGLASALRLKGLLFPLTAILHRMTASGIGPWISF